MGSYLENHLKPLRRRIILEFLAKQKDFTSNGDLILAWINSTSDGVSVFYRDVVIDIAWLDEHGYISREDNDDFVIVEATQLGLRVAEGTSRADGIALPRARR